MPLRLMVVDDHQIVRQGLLAILEAEQDFQVVCQTGDGSQAIELAEKHRPDVLVLDLMLSGLSGLDVAREVVRRVPRTEIVFLTMNSEVAYVAAAFSVGANAYVLKDDGSRELLKAIREVAAERRFLSPQISEFALLEYTERAKNAPRDFDPMQNLTLREREVFQLTAEGLSASAIGDRLFISTRTVESHRVNLMRKLGLRNHKELILYAVRRGMLPESS